MKHLSKQIHTKPEFWEKSYQEGNVKWDIGKPTPIFSKWAHDQIRKQTICVLGAGNGWDAINLSKIGHNVTAVDFSYSAINNMKKAADELNVKINLLHENIFNLDKFYINTFDIIIEYTCFCAIDPDQRNQYVEIVNSILKNNGKLVAIFFPLDRDVYDGGPPFGVDFNQTIMSIKKYFSLVHKEFSKLSIKPRIGREVYVILEKNGN